MIVVNTALRWLQSTPQHTKEIFRRLKYLLQATVTNLSIAFEKLLIYNFSADLNCCNLLTEETGSVRIYQRERSNHGCSWLISAPKGQQIWFTSSSNSLPCSYVSMTVMYCAISAMLPYFLYVRLATYRCMMVPTRQVHNFYSYATVVGQLQFALEVISYI